MDTLFEASFAPVASSGKPLSKCGRCRRYMRYLQLRPQRLFCPTCEEVYTLPQQGSIKLWKEATCPLDGFELLVYQNAGGAVSFVLCPYCYNIPPVKEVAKALPVHTGGKPGMPCSTCPHSTCAHSVGVRGIFQCPECEEGAAFINEAVLPRFRVECNHCHMMLTAKGLATVARADDVITCEICASRHVHVEFQKGHSPLGDDKLTFDGCLTCDVELAACFKHSAGSFVGHMFRGRRRGRGRGRGRGRRRGGTRS